MIIKSLTITPQSIYKSYFLDFLSRFGDKSKMTLKKVKQVIVYYNKDV